MLSGMHLGTLAPVESQISPIGDEILSQSPPREHRFWKTRSSTPHTTLQMPKRKKHSAP